jgi:4'-phosphopantetheinyl transferase
MTYDVVERPPMNVPAPGETHVWSAVLSAPASALAYCAGLLSPDEAARAARFYFAADRERFTLARGLLRLLLGTYLGADPRPITFSYSTAGKPSIEQPFAGLPLRFNLAHSGGRAVYALARGPAVGIDIERLRDGVDCDDLARRFFAPGEDEALARLPARPRRRAFFETWTRKEALLKATGGGIAAGLDRLAIGRGPGPRLVIERCALPGVDPLAWSLVDLSIARGFVAALAVESPAVKVVRRSWRW